MTRGFLGILLSLCLGCKQSGVKHVIPGKSSSVQVAKKEEYLNWDSVKFKGEIPMASALKNTVEKLGKPDSIDNEKRVYFGGARFSRSKDSLKFCKIDFRKDTAACLTSNKITLGYLTTLNDLKKVFPVSGNNELHHTAMDQYIAVDIGAGKKGSNDAWMFSFGTDGNKLLSVEYYIEN